MDYLMVATYDYGDRIVEIPSHPTSQAHAEWLRDESGRLNEGSEHILSAVVMSEPEYRKHRKTLAISALLEAS